MLRNAFDGLATDGTLGRVIAKMNDLLRAVSYARDPQDRMRVIIDNAPTVTATINAGNTTGTMQGAGTNPSHWTSASWNVVDDRWEFANGLNSTFNSTRSRWSF